MSLSDSNTKAVQDIESAILLVCLDAESATTDDARAWSYWAGGHDRRDGGKGFNRWFDKHEIIVDAKGESGFNGERESFRSAQHNKVVLWSFRNGFTGTDNRLYARRNTYAAYERVHAGRFG